MNLRGNCRQPYHTVSIGWIDWSARATTTLIVVHVLADVIARVDRYHNHICVWFDVIYIFLDFSVAVAALYTFFWCGRALGDRIETRYKLKVNIHTHFSIDDECNARSLHGNSFLISYKQHTISHSHPTHIRMQIFTYAERMMMITNECKNVANIPMCSHSVARDTVSCLAFIYVSPGTRQRVGGSTQL